MLLANKPLQTDSRSIECPLRTLLMMRLQLNGKR